MISTGLLMAAFCLSGAQDSTSDTVWREALYRVRGVEDFARFSKNFPPLHLRVRSGPLSAEEEKLYRDGYVGVGVALEEELADEDGSFVVRVNLGRTEAATDEDLDAAALAFVARYRRQMVPVVRERLASLARRRDALEKTIAAEAKALGGVAPVALVDPKAAAAASATRSDELRFRLADVRIDRAVKEAQLAALRARYLERRARAIELALAPLRDELSEAAAKYAPGHPELAAMTTRLERARARFDSIGPPDEGCRALHDRVAELEMDLVGIEAREASVESSLREEEVFLAQLRERASLAAAAENLAVSRTVAADLAERIARTESLLEQLEKGRPERL